MRRWGCNNTRVILLEKFEKLWYSGAFFLFQKECNIDIYRISVCKHWDIQCRMEQLHESEGRKRWGLSSQIMGRCGYQEQNVDSQPTEFGRDRWRGNIGGCAFTGFYSCEQNCSWNIHKIKAFQHTNYLFQRKPSGLPFQANMRQALEWGLLNCWEPCLDIWYYSGYQEGKW